jgi:peptide chain release factor subunit 1
VDVAGTITWDQLRELAGFRAEQGCAVSLYLNLDPSDVPTAGDAQTRMRSLLGEAERVLAERKSSLGHAAREALKADLERIGRWFDDDFDRDGVRGVAVFASSLANFWQTISVPDPVEDEAKIGSELYLAPLARLVGRGDGALVAFVGRERGQVFRLRGGQLVEVADHTEAAPGQHDQGGWSQARFERHIENIVGQHLRRVAETLDAHVRKMRGLRVLLVGGENIRSELEALLSNEVKSCLVGWATAEAHADATQLLETVRPLLAEWWAGREQELLERWREEAGKHGRAAAGWEQTLEAASDGRVDVLLVHDGARQGAHQCPACGRAQVADGSCPLDGTTLERRDDGLDLAVHQTLSHGGTIQVIREGRDLEPVGGVGALLRY